MWKDGMLVLDTNVLLNLYRYNAKDREALIGVLEKEKRRLWIPHQVALEYQHRRLGVIDGRLSSYESVLASARDAVEKIRKEHEEKRIKDDDINSFLEKTGAELLQLEGRLKTTHAKEEKALLDDVLRNRIEGLFEGRVGEPPPDQKWLDEVCRDGAARDAAKVPPGYLDKPTGEAYSWRGLRFQQGHGDLIIWRQIQDKAKADNWSDLILVTDDRKDDWWWRSKGERIGPRPELVSELLTNTALNGFWMYDSARFLEYANRTLSATVGEDTIRNVRELGGPLTLESFETVAHRWDAHDLHMDVAVDSSTDFYAQVHVGRLDQIFAVYYQVLSPIGAYWIGFTNRDDEVYLRRGEWTSYLGQKNQLSYSLIDSVEATVCERFPNLRGQPLRIVRIRCRGDAAELGTAKFYVGIRKR